jgi:CDP-diglyceride synthetase
VIGRSGELQAGSHGGLLDRLDAVVFAIAVGYYLSLALGY